GIGGTTGGTGGGSGGAALRAGSTSSVTTLAHQLAADLVNHSGTQPVTNVAGTPVRTLAEQTFAMARPTASSSTEIQAVALSHQAAAASTDAVFSRFGLTANVGSPLLA